MKDEDEQRKKKNCLALLILSDRGGGGVMTDWEGRFSQVSGRGDSHQIIKFKKLRLRLVSWWTKGRRGHDFHSENISSCPSSRSVKMIFKVENLSFPISQTDCSIDQQQTTHVYTFDELVERVSHGIKRQMGWIKARYANREGPWGIEQNRKKIDLPETDCLRRKWVSRQLKLKSRWASEERRKNCVEFFRGSGRYSNWQKGVARKIHGTGRFSSRTT